MDGIELSEKHFFLGNVNKHQIYHWWSEKFSGTRSGLQVLILILPQESRDTVDKVLCSSPQLFHTNPQLHVPLF